MVCPAWTETPSDVRAPLAAGDPAGAETIARAAVARAESAGDPALAGALDALLDVLLLSDRGAEPEAIGLAERAVGLRRVGAGEPADLASSLTRLGEALTAAQRWDEAAEALTEAEALFEPSDQTAHGRVLSRVAAVRRAQGDLPEAARLYAAAVAGLAPSTSPGDAERDKALYGLGETAYRLRDMATAQRVFQQLVEERTLTLGEGDTAVAYALQYLAKIAATLGDLEEAQDLCREAIAVLEAALGPDHPHVGAVVNDLAVSTRKRGDYLEARRLFERGIAIYENALGPEHPFVAGMLNNLGGVLLSIGDLGAARQTYERALAIREASLGPDSPEVAQSLSNLGNVFLKEDEAGRAVPVYERALAIRERTLGADAPEVGVTLVSLGDALQQVGELESAQLALERAVGILESSPQRVWDLAAAFNNLGLVLLRQERLAEGADALARARGIIEGMRGHDHPLTATAIFNEAKPAAFLGRLDAALGLLLEAARIGREHLGLTAVGLSEREALAYATQHQGALELALSLAVEPSLDDPTLIATAWDAVIRSRGLVLNEMASRRRLVISGDSGNASLTDALRAAADRLSRLLVEGPGADAGEVEAARRNLEHAERALGEASPPFARERQWTRLGLEEVVASMPPGSALVAYARFHRRFTQDAEQRYDTQAPWYLAFVRTPDGRVQVLPLADAATVEPLVAEWRSAASRPAGAEQTAFKAGELLRRLVWDPVASRLDDAERVFIVPDGELGLVNLAALPTGPDTFLVEQHPPLAMLDQEQDLVPEPFVTLAGPCLLAIGAPDYEAAPGVAATARIAAAAAPAEPPHSPPRSLTGTRFSSLPGTVAETDTVVALWAGAGGGLRALQLTGTDASEAVFKALAPGFRVLHLATHGFFLGNDLPYPSASERGVGALVAAGPEMGDPAGEERSRLSGLALAGANRRSGDSTEDGILTAEEIAVLDLGGVEWAVLSACESGVGEVSTREGVFGLRRAFRIAGARTVIMSLWAVDDEAAREWMTALYRARLVEGLNTAEAARRASLDVLAARRRRGESVHPASWAAFVASGDWR